MWHFEKTDISNQRLQKYVLKNDAGSNISYSIVLKLWQKDSRFRELFIQQLVEAPYQGFRWETPPLSNSNVNRDFEFVLLQCDALERPVDARAFAEHFDSTESVVKFVNLGKNAEMVVPRPVADDSIYGHFASFVRNAPSEQVHSLLKLMGSTMSEQLNEKPTWLSTAGMGVAWLHVRLDTRPKYYGYQPYKMDHGTA